MIDVDKLNSVISFILSQRYDAEVKVKVKENEEKEIQNKVAKLGCSYVNRAVGADTAV